MSQKIDQILQDLIPELKQQVFVESSDFEGFSAWINQSVGLLHYIELKEYFDNGVEDNYYFKKFNVNTEQVQADIEQETAILFERFEADSDTDSQEGFEDAFDAQIDVMEQTENIIFDKIQAVASAYQLFLLVVYRENPYWLLVPTTNEEELSLIVKAFNQAFNDDGDLNMAIYEQSAS